MNSLVMLNKGLILYKLQSSKFDDKYYFCVFSYVGLFMIGSA